MSKKVCFCPLEKLLKSTWASLIFCSHIFVWRLSTFNQYVDINIQGGPVKVDNPLRGDCIQSYLRAACLVVYCISIYYAIRSKGDGTELFDGKPLVFLTSLVLEIAPCVRIASV